MGYIKENSFVIFTDPGWFASYKININKGKQEQYLTTVLEMK